MSRVLLFCLVVFGLVSFSLGWDRFNVQIVANGTHFDRTAEGVTISEPGSSPVFQTLPEDFIQAQKRESGWIASSWSYSSSYSWYSALWWVPNTPTNNNGQILFFFNSFENSQYNDILQPVLQFNNGVGGWTVASWYGANGNYFEATPYPVNPGDAITGIIWLTGGTWYILGYVNNVLRTQITVSAATVGVQTSAQFAMEVYNVYSCNMYPPQNYVIVNQISLHDGNGNNINPSWSPSINSGMCSFSAYGSGSAVQISWVSGGGCGTYTVVSGDTLYHIAHDIYHDAFTWQALCSYNNLSNCNAISVGQVLNIPNC